MKLTLDFHLLANCRIGILILLLFSSTISVNAQDDTSAIEGRWDLTITMADKQLPSWLEVQHSGVRTLVGRLVFASGSARR